MAGGFVVYKETLKIRIMKPITRIDEENATISFLDDRYYPKDDKFYVSITHVLGTCFPKGIEFEIWLKDVGHNAKMIAERAADSGTKVHHAVEMLGNGVRVEWNDSIYNLVEWKGVMAGEDFLTAFVDRIEASEAKVYNDDEEYAGRLDIVVIIAGERWLLDYKFSNGVYKNHYIQLSAYRYAWDLMHPDNKIDKMGILWLKARTRGRDKSEKKIQGKGWQLLNPEDISTYKNLAEHYDTSVYELLYDQFLRTLNTWKFLNPEAKPKNLIYPMELSVDFENKYEEELVELENAFEERQLEIETIGELEPENKEELKAEAILEYEPKIKELEELIESIKKQNNEKNKDN